MTFLYMILDSIYVDLPLEGSLFVYLSRSETLDENPPFLGLPWHFWWYLMTCGSLGRNCSDL
jgi:hypothetical protein